MNPLRRIAATRFRIATQLYAGIGAAVALTMVASLVAWFSFNQVGDAQGQVNEQSVPEMSAAFGVAQRAGRLVAAAPRLVAAASPAELAVTNTSVDNQRVMFEDQLAALVGEEERHQRIRELGAALTANIDAIKDSMAERFELAERVEAVRTELAELQRELARHLVVAIDDQLFYAMTGYQDLGAPPAERSEHLSEPELTRYRLLAGLAENATISTQILASAFNLSSVDYLAPLRDSFLAAVEKIDRSLPALGEAPMHSMVRPAFARLRELGLGDEGGGFALRTQELRLSAQQQALLAANHELADELVAEVELLVEDAEASARLATRASEDAIGTGRGVLLALNVLSIVGAALIAWLFVGRVLLRRIGRLSDRMRAMADGDLEAEVDISGRDEVADMAKALEVFRRHALEVQRLNLVEKLADELRGKNEQLESALTDLQRAQDQMVAQEKLAALGELTAGVAHEIKNPLNFVKNFSEASEELLEELAETLAEVEEALNEDQRSLVDEIKQDLVENLGRIRHHGDRADRIVRDMLTMGRDSGERQATDINTLLDEHVKLAFHAARATDPDFQLTIDQNLDPDLGLIDVVPQDLGRVFLNMVTNACYATNERRQASGDGSSYQPTLNVTTRNLGDHIEVAIRDNGSGIPQQVIDKIFNPFFTTKPTDKGTGLGLALSNDIVRQHGGSIRVESEDGSFTEMTVTVPRNGTASDAPASQAG